MGTNYYLQKAKCKHCGRRDDDLHIGKHSRGWAFLLHVYDPSPKNLKEWIEMFIKDDNTIVDEYGHSLTAGEMLDIICTLNKDENKVRWHIGHEFIRGGLFYDITRKDFC